MLLEIIVVAKIVIRGELLAEILLTVGSPSLFIQMGHIVIIEH